MIEAIIAAIVAVVILVGALVFVFVMRSRTQTPYAGQKKDVRSVENVVGSANPFSKYAHAPAPDTVQVGESPTAGKPAAGLNKRFTALGVFAAAVFGVLGIRAGSMQLFGSESYSSEAEGNLYRTVSTPAPRGTIYDAGGVALVKNRASETVLADSSVADDRDVMQRLSAVLGVPVNVVRQRIQDSSAGAQSQRVVASDVRIRDVAFIAEHADAFPNVSVETRTVREYPYGALAAHVLGYTGTPSEADLEVALEGRVLESTDEIGKSGVELSYDNLLAGEHGARKVTVDAQGNVLDVVSETQPDSGSDLYLTIRGPVQYIADQALAETVGPDNGLIGSGKGVGAAVVAMDVRDGSVLAMASYPTYDPGTFTGGITQDIWDLYSADEAHAPLTNRSISGQYPAASTYKAFTSLAGLEYGFADYNKTWVCTGEWDGFGTGDVQRCWLRTGHYEIDLHRGIVVSCDTVFYEIAKAFFDHGPKGLNTISETALQDEIKKYNFGTATGIDLGSEAVGRVPTPEWKAEYWRDVPSEAVFRGGDYTNMIIGQGDVLVTPMQIAVAYGGIATGKIMKPHVLGEVRNRRGETAVKVEPEVVSEPQVKQEYLDFVRDALHDMVLSDHSISALFREGGVDAAGKTGTGEHANSGTDAWFVCYAPYDDPKYVVSCVVELGGGGGEVAAPIAAKVMNALFAYDEGTLETNMARVAPSPGKEVAGGAVVANTGRSD